jgi:hypothetical protein
VFSVSVKRSLLVTLFLALTIFVLSAPVDAATVTPSKQLYAAGEPIIVSFADFPWSYQRLDYHCAGRSAEHGVGTLALHTGWKKRLNQF